MPKKPDLGFRSCMLMCDLLEELDPTLPDANFLRAQCEFGIALSAAGAEAQRFYSNCGLHLLAAVQKAKVSGTDQDLLARLKALANNMEQTICEQNAKTKCKRTECRTECAERITGFS